MAYKYDVAISFAGEDRSHAESLVMALVSKGIRVFYDKLEEHYLWGKDLVENLYEIYSKQARYCIILISKHYVQKKKIWTKHERKSAQERALHQEDEYILPIRLDDVLLPGFPDTIAYIKFNDYTVDELANLVVKKLGFPLSDIVPVETISQTPSLKEKIPPQESFDPTQDLRFVRHETRSKNLFTLKNQCGYFALHSFLVPEKDVSAEIIQNTFLDINRTYSESLSYSSPPDVHPTGYTRRYEINKKSGRGLTTQATTCYFDGYIVTEGYIDEYRTGEEGFNPNWFTYKIQRHLQLSKEVFEGFATDIIFAVIFQYIEKFKWEIYKHGKIWEEKAYVGYHENIVLPINLLAIHGRDKWNIKINIVEDIMVRVARMFGMDKLPQPYWNEVGQLDFSHGMPNR